MNSSMGSCVWKKAAGIWKDKFSSGLFLGIQLQKVSAFCPVLNVSVYYMIICLLQATMVTI